MTAAVGRIHVAVAAAAAAVAAAIAAAAAVAAAGAGGAAGAADGAADAGNGDVPSGSRVVPSACSCWAFCDVRLVLSIGRSMTKAVDSQKTMACWHQKWTQNLLDPCHDPNHAAMPVVR